VTAFGTADAARSAVCASGTRTGFSSLRQPRRQAQDLPHRTIDMAEPDIETCSSVITSSGRKYAGVLMLTQAGRQQKCLPGRDGC